MRRSREPRSEDTGAGKHPVPQDDAVEPPSDELGGLLPLPLGWASREPPRESREKARRPRLRGGTPSSQVVMLQQKALGWG